MPAATFVSGSPGGSHPLSFQQHAKEVSFGCQVQLFVVGWQGPVVAPARWAFLSKTPAHLGLRQDSHRIQNPWFSFTLNRVMSCYWHTGRLANANSAWLVWLVMTIGHYCYEDHSSRYTPSNIKILLSNIGAVMWECFLSDQMILCTNSHWYTGSYIYYLLYLFV